MLGLLGKVYAGGGKLALAALAVLVVVGNLGAQGGEGSGECTFLASVQDNTCGNGNCPQSSNFSPPCDDYYKFAGQAWCAGNREYAIYRITAYLYDATLGGPIATIKNWDEENCGGTQWPDEIQVQLWANHSYYLKVCLDPCYGHNCSDCSSGGYALAKVYHL
jgi:hypothetical protein